MCGIVGIINLREPKDVDAALLARMNELQFHRGPDEGGLHTEPGLGLGHRRLSIIDLSTGQQPLFNEDHSVVVVFNGEIYNFRELAQELTALGHEFRTRSDTEVIVHAWEEWGASCVQRFRGMFAFAVWDSNLRTLFLARDRLGIKPLYYAELADGQIIFASEMKSLMIHPELKRDLDYHAIEEYFTFGYVPEPRSILRQVKKLAPGHTLTLQCNHPAPEPVKYWDIPFTPVTVGSEEDIAQELIERIREAVDIRMVAEVPLGAFLSGGVDSSAIVAMMAGLSPNDPINTCSIGFGDPKFNETEFAAMVAERYHTRHHVEQVDPNDFELLDKLAELYDEPYADSSAIPTYRVCELARKRVTVALSGDGGDENLAGYRRYRWHMLEEKIRGPIPQSIRGPLFGFLGRAYPKLDWAPKFLRAKSTFQSMASTSIEGYLNSVSIMHGSLREKMFSPKLQSELQKYRAIEVFKTYAASAPTDHPLSLAQYLDMKTYLPGDILTKVDRASMAHALEVRVPLLDHKLMEWISGLDPELKLRKQEGKYIFKRALEPHLPQDVLYRAKMGFAVPLESWFRGPLRQKVRDALLGDTLNDTGLFNSHFLRRMVDDHQSGIKNHTAAIWSLLMFEAFVRGNLH